jgi:hypothetical protein
MQGQGDRKTLTQVYEPHAPEQRDNSARPLGNSPGAGELRRISGTRSPGVSVQREVSLCTTVVSHRTGTDDILLQYRHTLAYYIVRYVRLSSERDISPQSDLG